MPSFKSPQVPQQSNRQRLKPRGKQFKKHSNSSSSGSVSSGGSGSGGGVTCGQCGGRQMTLQCHGVQGLCHNCGQPGNFAQVCPTGGHSLSQSQQGSAGGSSFGGPSRPQFPGPQQAQVNTLTSEQAADMPERIIAAERERANRLTNKRTPRVNYCYAREISSKSL
ncbi:hypothetical protein F511_16045 [Dorcoceras hygrometricum]|uniref:CCHC-type domain-containing protein n=1 Tax=Dorcoceras hygrometricum TaxID=472368 RepID=A0A2Z7B889_9LAMI|nr:hypothetical protein F511_16045 [Dorcoceras hygrometricum]